MEREQEGAKWVTHYSSDHQILLVGDGDFSFSLSLAHSFGSPSNIVASSLDSYDDVTKKYKRAKSNLKKLRELGAYLLHGVDATKMMLHSDLKMRRFDRIIFNFPHAGFHGKEENLSMIKMHKDLVLGFFMNASCMLRANGEIHVNHKTSPPFDKWDIEKLAAHSFLTLIERADFKKEDYPGYYNKRGDGHNCDKPFPLGKCSTFKFIYNPRAMGRHERRNQIGSRQPINLAFQEMQGAGKKSLTTSIDLDYYPHPSHISKLNETVTTPLFGISNGYSPPCGTQNNVAHRITAPCAAYSAHCMVSGSQRMFQPLQPMEPLKSFHPWPKPTNVRYSLVDHVRTRDIVSLSLGARNEGYQVSSVSSNYLREALGGTSQSTSCYSYDRVKPEFESYISEMHWTALNDDMNVHRQLVFMEERRRMFFGR